jgi:hypothetical protein
MYFNPNKYYMSNQIHCPRCNSTQITANKKGFSAGKAAAGALLTGGMGLLAGTHGSGNIRITCLTCGHKFKPGEGKIKHITEITNDRVEINNGIDIEQLVIHDIKKHGLIFAVKSYKQLTGKDLRESKDRVDEIAKKYNVTPENMNNSGCAGVMVVVALFILCLIAFHSKAQEIESSSFDKFDSLYKAKTKDKSLQSGTVDDIHKNVFFYATRYKDAKKA